MATVKVDPEVVKKFLAASHGSMTPSSITKHVKHYTANPDVYAAVAKMVSQFSGAPADASEAKLFNFGVIKKFAALELGVGASAKEVEDYAMSLISACHNNPGLYQRIVDKVNAFAGSSTTSKTPVKVKPTPVKTEKAKPYDEQLYDYLDSLGKNEEDGVEGAFPLDTTDIDVSRLLAAIRTSVRAKAKEVFSSLSPYTAMERIKNGATFHKDQEEYLSKILKFLNPDYKPSVVPSSIKPGEYYDLPTPNDELTPYAKTKMPSKKKADEAAKLQAKIEAFEAEIQRLKERQQEVDRELSRSMEAKRKLAQMNPKLVKYFSYIEQNCGQALKSMKKAKEFLYRGQSDATSPVFVGYPRADRQPKDSDGAAQELMDKYLTMTGFKALRSNSIFTSSDGEQASNYGTIYAIFPKDGFSFTWSTKHDDIVLHSVNEVEKNVSEVNVKLYNDVDDIIEDLRHNFRTTYMETLDDAKEKAGPDTEAHEKYSNVSDLVYETNRLWSKTYSTSPERTVAENIIKIVDASRVYEKMFGVKLLKDESSITQLNDIYDQAKNILSKVDTTSSEQDRAKRVITDWGFKRTNFVAALKSQHEICILGEYVAVKFHEYQTPLTQYFFGDKDGNNDVDEDDFID